MLIVLGARDDAAQCLKLNELVRLTAQFISDHRRMRTRRRDNRDAFTLALYGINHATEITVAGEKHDMVDARRKLHRVDGKLDIHIAFDAAAALRVGEFLGGLGHNGIAIVVEPVDQRSQRRVVLIFDERGVIIGADQCAFGTEIFEQAAVVDVEVEAARRRIEIGTINKKRDALLRVKVHLKKPYAILQYGQGVNADCRLYGLKVIEVNAVLKWSRERFGKIYKAYDMILIGLGANLPTAEGPPLVTLKRALALLPAFGVSVIRCSSFYRTPAIAHDVQPPYVNAVAVVAAALPAADLLAGLHRLETQFGRARHVRWAPRTLDLDLLDYEGQIVTSELGNDSAPTDLHFPLTLPHPRMDKRGFVLVPLAEVAPGWRHPVSGASAAALLDRLKAAEGVAALTGIERI